MTNNGRWQRAPEHDKRKVHGAEYNGDAWRNDAGELRWTAPGGVGPSEFLASPDDGAGK